MAGRAIDLARGNGAAVGRLDHVNDSLRTAVIRQTQRHGHIFGGRLRIGNADSLIRPKEEQLVLMIGPPMVRQKRSGSGKDEADKADW